MVKSHQNAAPLPNKCQSRPPMGGSCHLQNMKTDFFTVQEKFRYPCIICCRIDFSLSLVQSRDTVVEHTTKKLDFLELKFRQFVGIF